MSYVQKIGWAVSILYVMSSCRNSASNGGIESIIMRPSNTAFSDTTKMLPGDLSKLLTSLDESPESTKITVISVPSGIAAEPSIIDKTIVPSDLEALGYQKSKFIADSRWATIRYVGPESGTSSNPAGAGLTGKEQNDAQIDALGKANDSIPVVTAAWVITKIMDEHFVPILRTLPNGENILSNLKIQGAYFAPGYIPAIGKKEVDNAFVVGLQSLYLWPSSCFDTPQRSDCKVPYMSTGHDPTVVAHELSHAIFNLLRNGQSLDGFQWNAVNEGYADYFSASYFSEPRIGRIWKVAGASVQHLRAIDGKPTTSSPTIIAEAHQFSTVWSSALWRIRNRIITEKKGELREVDRMILFSITFLGETEKIRLGDAGIALLKSAESTSHTEWKTIIREEMGSAEIAFAKATQASSNSTPNIGESAAAAEKSSSCGSVAAKNHSAAQFLFTIPLLTCAIGAIFSLRRNPR